MTIDMATLKTTLRDWLGLPGAVTRAADSRHARVVRWLRRLACLGVCFAVAGAVMQAFGHPWGPDALGLGLTMLVAGFALSTWGDLADRRDASRDDRSQR